jgi:hypothetical protein
MKKPVRPNFATSTVAAITGEALPPPVNPDEALWPMAGRPAAMPSQTAAQLERRKDDKDLKDGKDGKLEKITFSNKLEASTYLRLQQLATYGGETIQEILEAALQAYFADKEEASRPLPPKVLATLRRRYPFL